MAEIIEMPKLSDTMTSGTLIKWLKKEGESVSAGDMIAEVETDKATMEVEVFEDGMLLKHYINEGESVAIGSPICAIGEEGEEAPEVEVENAPPPGEEDGDDADGDDDETEASGESEEEAEEPEPEPESEPEEESEAEETEASEETESEPEDSAPEPETEPLTDREGRIKASPLARKVAADLGIDLSRLKGTGPGGRIVRKDVENAPKPVAVASGSAAAPGVSLGELEERTETVSNMRASIAKALVKSKREAPHFYLQKEVDAAALARTREDLNHFLSELPEDRGGIKYTVNDLILRAAALAVLKVPAINRSWQGKTIRQDPSVHLAFGVAVEAGLVTPVIRDAHRKSLRQIALEARALIAKARNRKLKPEEMSGSTLTVTNLGMYGISDFYGIINPGNAAILSVGAAVKTPVVTETNQIVVGQRMKVGLSGDHRVIDGAVGAQYLQALATILEKPAILLA